MMFRSFPDIVQQNTQNGWETFFSLSGRERGGAEKLMATQLL